VNLDFTEQDRAFQQEARQWLQTAWPKEMREWQARSALGKLSKEDIVQWQKKLAEKGWAATNWPVEYGGADFTPTQKYIFDLERARVGAPGVLPFGMSMVAPVIMKFGTQAQKDKYLPDILASNVWWCQGYSEPGAGSDLASLKTKAEDQGDHYLVNGVKTWTTMAQHADMMFCLVRTSQESKRQLGISFLLIDMNSAGVSVNPIVTLDQPPAGAQEINMVYLDNVEVPKENLVGEEGKGWTCAKYLLEFERGGGGAAARLFVMLDELRVIAALESPGGVPLAADPVFRARIDVLAIRIQSLEFTELATLARMAKGESPGPASSLAKNASASIEQALTVMKLEAIGHYALADTGRMARADLDLCVPAYAETATARYLNARAASIFGGSEEVQKNIIARAVLGL
jgi:alkylation response protein AidB-like acyl-CoA dehydrogenase